MNLFIKIPFFFYLVVKVVGSSFNRRKSKNIKNRRMNKLIKQKANSVASTKDFYSYFVLFLVKRVTSFTCTTIDELNENERSTSMIREFNLKISHSDASVPSVASACLKRFFFLESDKMLFFGFVYWFFSPFLTDKKFILLQ